jgi:ribosome-binding factor A
MAYRQERLEKIIERELSSILLMDVKDDRLKYVSITKVTLTKDYSIATIYYLVHGTPEQAEATGKTLEEAKGFLRSEISKRIDLRKSPELRFKRDESLEYGSKIENILKVINKNTPTEE